MVNMITQKIVKHRIFRFITCSDVTETLYSSLCAQNMRYASGRSQHALEASTWIENTWHNLNVSFQLNKFQKLMWTNCSGPGRIIACQGILLPSNAFLAADAVSASVNWINACQDMQMWERKHNINATSELTKLNSWFLTWKPAAFSKVAILWTKPKAEKTWNKF